MVHAINNKDVDQFIAAIQKGNKRAFELLFKRNYEALSRFAWRYVHSKAIAEELVQEVFANVWENRANWQPSVSIQSYLFRAVRNQAIDHIRHQQIEEEYNEAWVAENHTSVVNAYTNTRKDKLAQTLKKEIEALPARAKMTFKLSRYDGLTYREISQVMDISVKTVESQMSHALRKLRNRLSYLLPVIGLIACFIALGLA